jgi:hypothetical protein
MTGLPARQARAAAGSGNPGTGAEEQPSKLALGDAADLRFGQDDEPGGRAAQAAAGLRVVVAELAELTAEARQAADAGLVQELRDGARRLHEDHDWFAQYCVALPTGRAADRRSPVAGRVRGHRPAGAKRRDRSAARLVERSSC